MQISETPRINKYYKLAEFFKSATSDLIKLTYTEIENIIGFQLPYSKKYRQWWANDLTHSQSVWLDYGYEVIAVDLGRQVVTFQKNN